MFCSHWRLFYSTFFTDRRFFHFNIISSRHFFFSTFSPHRHFFPSALFPVDAFSFSTFCPRRIFFSWTCYPRRRFFPFDLISHLAFFLSTPSTFFTVNVFIYIFSVNRWNSCPTCLPVTSRASLAAIRDRQVKITTLIVLRLAVFYGKWALVRVYCGLL